MALHLRLHEFGREALSGIDPTHDDPRGVGGDPRPS